MSSKNLRNLIITVVLSTIVVLGFFSVAYYFLSQNYIDRKNSESLFISSLTVSSNIQNKMKDDYQKVYDYIISEIGEAEDGETSSIGSGIYRITGLTKNMIEKEKDYFKGFIEEFHKLLNKAFEIEKKLSLSNIDKKFTYRPKEEYTFSYQDVINMRKELDLLQEEVKAFDKEATRLLNESIEKTFVNYKDMLTDKGGVIGLNEFERGYLRPLIDYLTSIKPNITVALVDKVSSKLQVLIKTNKDGVDASSLLKDALLIADGKGGGKKDFASGGAPSDSKYDEVIEFLRSKIL